MKRKRKRGWKSNFRILFFLSLILSLSRYYYSLFSISQTLLFFYVTFDRSQIISFVILQFSSKRRIEREQVDTRVGEEVQRESTLAQALTIEVCGKADKEQNHKFLPPSFLRFLTSPTIPYLLRGGGLALLLLGLKLGLSLLTLLRGGDRLRLGLLDLE